MTWTLLEFGKHAGKTLPQVLWTDPDWFFFAYEEKVLHQHLSQKEIDILHWRATHIRAPKQGGKRSHFRYHLDHRGGVARVELVADSEATAGDQKYLDLRHPRLCRPYDKLGYRIVIRSLTFMIFGSTRTKMTRKKADQFYADKTNFAKRKKRPARG